VQSQSHAPTEKENAAAMMEEFDVYCGSDKPANEGTIANCGGSIHTKIIKSFIEINKKIK